MKNYDWLNVQLSIRRYFEHYAANPEILEEHSRFIIYELISILKRALVYNQDTSGVDLDRGEIDELLKYTTLQDMSEGVVNLFKKYYNLMLDKQNCGTNRTIRKIKEYICNNYMNDINLTDAAESAYLSPSSLSKLFHKETGVLFSDYLTQCRLEKAKELLLRTDLKIYEISVKIGYNSEKHFIKQFKKVTGFSPMEFRKNYVK